LIIKWPLCEDDRDKAQDQMQEARQRAFEAVGQVYAKHHHGSNYQHWLQSTCLEDNHKTAPSTDDDCSSSEDSTTLMTQMLESNQVLENDKAQLQARVQILEDIKMLLEKNNAMLKEGMQLVGNDKALLEERVGELERSKTIGTETTIE